MSAKPKRTGSIVSVQMPDELRAKLQNKATSANRSLSAEILRRLERSFSVQALQEDAIEVVLEDTFAQLNDQVEKHVAVSKQLAERLAEVLKDQQVEAGQTGKRSRGK